MYAIVCAQLQLIYGCRFAWADVNASNCREVAGQILCSAAACGISEKFSQQTLAKRQLHLR